MSAVNVFLAIVGVVITGLVVAGMVFLEPHHLISPAVQTDLSDVKPDPPAGPNINRPPVTEPALKPPPRQQVAPGPERPLNGNRLTGDDRTPAQPKEPA